MSIIVHSEDSEVPAEVLEYAYTRADRDDSTVVIYRRFVPPMVLCEPGSYSFIATGDESDHPEGYEIAQVIAPRSSVYDNPNAFYGERCC